MRKIGLDLGSSRIGVALSDPLGILASPYGLLSGVDPAGLRAYLIDLAAREGADEVVVGLPVTLRGEEGPQAEWVLGFAAALEGMPGIKVTFYDERLTSREASRRLAEAGRGGARARSRTDSAAAALLLQAWLQSERG